MTSQPRKQTIAIHILQYISRNKDKQTMKFGQLIECNMRNIFFQKSYIKCAGDTSPSHFPKNRNGAYLWINSLEIYKVYFYCMLSWGLSKYIEIKFRPLAFTSYKAFLKNKKRSRTSVCISFCALLFEEKHFSCYILLTDQMSLPDCLCFVRYWVIYVL